MPDVIRVAVVDDDTMARLGLVATLSAPADLSVVAQGRSAEDATDLGWNGEVDVLVLGLARSSQALLTVRRLRETGCRAAIVVLGASEDEDSLCAALAAGARAYVPRSRHAADLPEIVRSVTKGDTWVSPHVGGRILVARASRSAASREKPAPMSRDERIIRMVARGYSNTEIASELGLAEGAVAGCVATVVERLEALETAVDRPLPVRSGAGLFRH
ncbi:transcriptional regulator [Alsobacter sp. R-9]